MRGLFCTRSVLESYSNMGSLLTTIAVARHWLSEQAMGRRFPSGSRGKKRPNQHRVRMLSRSCQVSQVLATEAITLRMDAESQEAGFLSAYHPIPVTPSVVIIRWAVLAGIWTQQLHNSNDKVVARVSWFSIFALVWQKSDLRKPLFEPWATISILRSLQALHLPEISLWTLEQPMRSQLLVHKLQPHETRLPYRYLPQLGRRRRERPLQFRIC